MKRRGQLSRGNIMTDEGGIVSGLHRPARKLATCRGPSKSTFRRSFEDTSVSAFVSECHSATMSGARSDVDVTLP